MWSVGTDRLVLPAMPNHCSSKKEKNGAHPICGGIRDDNRREVYNLDDTRLCRLVGGAYYDQEVLRREFESRRPYTYSVLFSSVRVGEIRNGSDRELLVGSEG